MEENKLSIQNEISNEEIKNLIYTIRGKQVMLDSDVAMLYNYETKKVNQAVKRNIDRFPERFCFQLTEEELEIMWSQIVTTSKLEDNKYRSKKYLPYVFTEHGIWAMELVKPRKLTFYVKFDKYVFLCYNYI